MSVCLSSSLLELQSTEMDCVSHEDVVVISILDLPSYTFFRVGHLFIKLFSRHFIAFSYILSLLNLKFMYVLLISVVFYMFKYDNFLDKILVKSVMALQFIAHF